MEILKRIGTSWQALTLILAILGTGGVGALAYDDLTTQVAANTGYRLIQEFERLTIIRKSRPLTQIEWLTWCNAGKELGVFATCPERRL